VTAVDADTGVLQIFDRSSGVKLVDAVAASGAVPGEWPLARINGRSWIHGGMVSSANAHLADGYERVIILAPMPTCFGDIPGAEDDVIAMQQQPTVVPFSPDEESVLAIGPNPYDPSRRGPAAAAGTLPGLRVASIVEAMW
jgi:NTE family protein